VSLLVESIWAGSRMLLLIEMVLVDIQFSWVKSPDSSFFAPFVRVATASLAPLMRVPLCNLQCGSYALEIARNANHQCSDLRRPSAKLLPQSVKDANDLPSTITLPRPSSQH
jgi:hypothetical protein